MSKVAEDKLNLKKWSSTIRHCSLSDNYLVNECVVALRSGRTDFELSVKISRTASTKLNSFLEKEIQTIKYLIGEKVLCIPRLIDYGSIDDRVYFVMGKPKGVNVNPESQSLYAIATAVTQAVAEIYSKTKSKPVSSEYVVDKASNYLKIPSEYLEMTEVLDRLESLAPDDSVPTSLVHGYLVPNKVVIGPDGKTKLLDFTTSGLGEPPIDIPFFVFDFNLSKDRNVLLHPLGLLKHIKKLQPEFSSGSNSFLLVYGLIRSLGFKADILRVLEDELLIRDLQESLISLPEVGALLEIEISSRISTFSAYNRVEH